jgi:hypothetical protein
VKPPKDHSKLVTFQEAAHILARVIVEESTTDDENTKIINMAEDMHNIVPSIPKNKVKKSQPYVSFKNRRKQSDSLSSAMLFQ